MSDNAWTDTEVVACDGPSLKELGEASIDVMMQPHRERLFEITAAALAEPEAPALVLKLAGIVQALAECKPCKDVQTGYVSSVEMCVLCEETEGPGGIEHDPTCPWRQAVELLGSGQDD